MISGLLMMGDHDAPTVAPCGAVQLEGNPVTLETTVHRCHLPEGHAGYHHSEGLGWPNLGRCAALARGERCVREVGHPGACQNEQQVAFA